MMSTITISAAADTTTVKTTITWGKTATEKAEMGPRGLTGLKGPIRIGWGYNPTSKTRTTI